MSRILNERARDLRARMTDAESRLWRHLRAGRLRGAKFRRQQPLGPYIVDFVCFEAGLVIEVDGGQHLAATGDDERDRRLQAAGYRVLRFWNHEVLGQTGAVLEQIAAHLAPSPPTPPPRGGRGA